MKTWIFIAAMGGVAASGFSATVEPSRPVETALVQTTQGTARSGLSANSTDRGASTAGNVERGSSRLDLGQGLDPGRGLDTGRGLEMDRNNRPTPRFEAGASSGKFEFGASAHEPTRRAVHRR